MFIFKVLNLSQFLIKPPIQVRFSEKLCFSIHFGNHFVINIGPGPGGPYKSMEKTRIQKAVELINIRLISVKQKR